VGKPVPYNPYNFRDEAWIRRWGEAFVAVAGPLSNLAIVLVFGLFLRFFEELHAVIPVVIEMLVPAVWLIQSVVIMNIALAVFNLVPFPPLDGSKILFSLFPRSLQSFREFLERYQLFIALFFILFLWRFISPVIFVIYRLVVGA
jgi:Zn-dependent protease